MLKTFRPKYILFLIGLICVASGIDEGSFEQYFKRNLLTKGKYLEGKKVGQWYFYHPNKEIHFTGQYNRDKKTGTWQYFNENGELLFTANYKAGVLDSSLTYFREGVKWLQYEYHNGQRLNKTLLFHPNGQVKEKVVALDYGRAISRYYSNGKLAFRTINWLGKHNDTTRSFFPNGICKEELIFYKDVLLAVGTSRDSTGGEVSHGFFKDGKGTLIRYHNNGVVKSKAAYDRGVKHGIGQEYYENGELKAAGMYAFGKKSGVWKIYTENGVLERLEEHRKTEKDQKFKREFLALSDAIELESSVAQFPGGQKAFHRFLKDAFNRIELPKNKTIWVTAELNKDGFVEELSLDLPTELTPLKHEILESLKKFPRCKPAMDNGLPAKGLVTYPFET